MSGCPSCRRALASGAKFCPHCGQDLAAARRRPELREPPLRPDRRSRSGRTARGLALVLAGLALALLAMLLTRGQDVEVRPSPPVADLERAQAAIEARDWTAAMQALSATGEVPPTVVGRRLLAEVLHELVLEEGGARWLPRAMRARELALADEPSDLAGLRARAELESGFGDPLRAASWWQAALGEADRAEATDEVRDALLLDAAVAEALAGETGRAELLLEELLARRPEDARGLACRGLLHLDAGRTVLAEADLKKALELEPALEPAGGGLAELLRRQGRWAEAREAATAASSTLAGRHVLALIEESEADLPSALAWMEAALELAPDEPRLLGDHARMKAACGESCR